MLYLANASTQPVREAMSAGRLGSIMTPGGGSHPPAGAYWCADNGCFGSGYPGDAAWLRWLDTFDDDERSRCLFAVAPDVVGDAAATLERSAPFLPRLRELGYPAAFVAQDGLTPEAVPWATFDALFVGGSTGFKLGPDARHLVALARRRGAWVHMGRVNSERRLRYAQAIGCQSADGTYLAFGPRTNLPAVEAWLRGVAHPTLFELDG